MECLIAAKYFMINVFQICVTWNDLLDGKWLDMIKYHGSKLIQNNAIYCIEISLHVDRGKAPLLSVFLHSILTWNIKSIYISMTTYIRWHHPSEVWWHHWPSWAHWHWLSWSDHAVRWHGLRLRVTLVVSVSLPFPWHPSRHPTGHRCSILWLILRWQWWLLHCTTPTSFFPVPYIWNTMLYIYEGIVINFETLVHVCIHQ